MARHRIGLFGVLVAVGGILALRCVQKSRAAQTTTAREVSRWEGEGGAIARAAPAAPAVKGANGLHHPGANGNAWPFPRG
ncbi:hypothetical protein BWP39_11100 [Paraburkholderia acidicola]|uniref:Uncharacterized protein n=1 Tax=Paraburkholderia acidicola TaxID=1912599 RepID=A0A2A4EXN7_9BURK|nr:hypothetical protein [Paraburkholderia acidicola]PCE25064.1 hypothetical protein BWP39_11100 [Paraburkholderia acidicola]